MDLSFSFQSAYRQLDEMERIFVDGFVAGIEKIAAQTQETLQSVLYRQGQARHHEKTLEMLNRRLVGAAISERVKEIAEDNEMSEYKTLKEVRSIAHSNMGNYIDFTTGEIDFSGCTPDQMSAVKSYKRKTSPQGHLDEELVLHDKLKALDMTGKHMGLWSEEKWNERKSAQESAQIYETDDVEEAGEKYAKRIN